MSLTEADIQEMRRVAAENNLVNIENRLVKNAERLFFLDGQVEHFHNVTNLILADLRAIQVQREQTAKDIANIRATMNSIRRESKCELLVRVALVAALVGVIYWSPFV